MFVYCKVIFLYIPSQVSRAIFLHIKMRTIRTKINMLAKLKNWNSSISNQLCRIRIHYGTRKNPECQLKVSRSTWQCKLIYLWPWNVVGSGLCYTDTDAITHLNRNSSLIIQELLQEKWKCDLEIPKFSSIWCQNKQTWGKKSFVSRKMTTFSFCGDWNGPLIPLFLVFLIRIIKFCQHKYVETIVLCTNLIFLVKNFSYFLKNILKGEFRSFVDSKNWEILFLSRFSF